MVAIYNQIPLNPLEGATKGITRPGAPRAALLVLLTAYRVITRSLGREQNAENNEYRDD